MEKTLQDEYELLEKIGKGSFGNVFKVKKKESGELFAAKIITKENGRIELTREIEVLSQVANYFLILKYIKYSQKDFKNEDNPVIITEYLSSGTLGELLDEVNHSRAPDFWVKTQKIIIIFGIAAAMSYLHKNGIIHRDLKPNNILFKKWDHDYYYPKIIDFGLSKSLLEKTLDKTINFKGTVLYSSPEILSIYDYQKAGDVYAFAIIIYEILNESPPFYGIKDMKEIKKMVLKGERPSLESISITDPVFADLIGKCWEQDPEKRPSFDEILAQLERDKEEILSGDGDLDIFEDFIDLVKKEGYPPLNKKEEVHINSFKKYVFLYPESDFNRLSEENQNLVIEAHSSPEFQYEIGKCLIEGTHDFPRKVEIGVKYLKKSIRNNFIDAALYYCRLIIKGKIVERNLKRAKRILKSKIGETDEKEPFFILLGKLNKKKRKFKKAKDLFREAVVKQNEEACYEYGKMLYKGYGCTCNKKEAKVYFEMAKNKGFTKCDKYLNEYKSEDKKVVPHEVIPIDDSDCHLSITGDVSSRSHKPSATDDDDDHADHADDDDDDDDDHADDDFPAIPETGRTDSSAAKVPESGRSDDDSPIKNKVVYTKISDAAKHREQLASATLETARDDEVHPDKIKADNGDDEAMFRYAVYLFKKGTSESKEEASKYYEKAAKLKHKKSIFNYALMCEKADGIPYNKAKSERYFELGAELGCPYSCVRYGHILIERNEIDKATKYFKKAAKKNDVDGLYNYGLLLYKCGTVVNKATAAKYLKEAADQGHVLSMSIYALMRDVGDSIQCNKKEALKYYKMAADEGEINSMINLGFMYLRGEIIDQNSLVASRLFKEAAEKGNRIGMYNYALMNYNGEGVAQDKTEAARYFKMAANIEDDDVKNRNIPSVFFYGLMVYKGEVPTEETSEAAKYFKIAADNGHEKAMFCYAMMSYKSDRKTEAAEYFENAAKKGNRLAKKKLGQMLINGDGIPKDKEKGEFLLKDT